MKRKPVFKHKDLLHGYIITPGNIFETKWKNLSIPLDDLEEIWALIRETFVKYSATRVLSDNTVVRGKIPEEAYRFIEETMYPELKNLGLERIGVVIPVNAKMTRETLRWESIYKNSIEIRNFYTPSEALEWLREQ